MNHKSWGQSQSSQMKKIQIVNQIMGKSALYLTNPLNILVNNHSIKITDGRADSRGCNLQDLLVKLRLLGQLEKRGLP